MSLLDRELRATRCAVVDCNRERLPDAELCRQDTNELWLHHLDRQADGSYLRRRVFIARDESRTAA